jgi:hypothetical protein
MTNHARAATSSNVRSDIGNTHGDRILGTISDAIDITTLLAVIGAAQGIGKALTTGSVTQIAAEDVGA